MMLLCLCLFPFSGAWWEKQAAAEAPGASTLAIWGGNGDESLSSAYRYFRRGRRVVGANRQHVGHTRSFLARGGRDERRLDSACFRSGELKSETLLSWEGEPFILGAVENPEGLCMIVVESIDKTEYVENTGYIVKYNVSSKAIQREKLPGLPHDVYACGRGLLITGACAVDASHAAAWSAFVDASGCISWGYCSPEMYSENEIVLQKGVLRRNETILYGRKPDETPEKQYLRILDQSGRFLRDLPLPELEHFNIYGMLPTDEGVLIYGYKWESGECASMVFVHVDLEGRVLFSKAFADMQSVLSVCPASRGGYYFAENADDGLNVFYLSDDGETELLQSVPCDNLISCRNMYEEADGGLTCVGEMRVLTDDGCVREKLFILSLTVPFF